MPVLEDAAPNNDRVSICRACIRTHNPRIGSSKLNSAPKRGLGLGEFNVAGDADDIGLGSSIEVVPGSWLPLSVGAKFQLVFKPFLRAECDTYLDR